MTLGLRYLGCSGVGVGGRLLLILFGLQGYQWLKDKVQSEDSKKQQARVMDLLPIAHQLDCTVAQLAIGETLPTRTLQRLCLLRRNSQTQEWFVLRENPLPQRHF